MNSRFQLNHLKSNKLLSFFYNKYGFPVDIGNRKPNNIPKTAIKASGLSNPELPELPQIKCYLNMPESRAEMIRCPIICAVRGYHQQDAIRLLNRRQKRPRRRPGRRPVYYSPELLTALKSTAGRVSERREKPDD